MVGNVLWKQRRLMIQGCSRSRIIAVSKIGPGLLSRREQRGTAGERLSPWNVVHCGSVEGRGIEDMFVKNRVVFLIELAFLPILHMQGIRRLM